MNNICPEQVFDCFANVADYQKAKKLSSISIDRCICHLTLPTEGHSKIFIITASNVEFAGFIVCVGCKAKWKTSHIVNE